MGGTKNEVSEECIMSAQESVQHMIRFSPVKNFQSNTKLFQTKAKVMRFSIKHMSCIMLKGLELVTSTSCSRSSNIWPQYVS